MWKHISAYWNDKSKLETAAQSSLRYMSPHSLDMCKPSLVWTDSTDGHRDTTKAFVKVRLMTGTYRLQAHEALFNRGYANMSAHCLMCHKEPENRYHFLLRCMSLRDVRAINHGLLVAALKDYGLDWNSLSEECQLQLLLDVSDWRDVTQPRLDVCSIETIARTWIFHLHLGRQKILGSPHSIKKTRMGGPR